jgi:2-(1,2-epoxy-1,2-dihydrophenyl)acetyl-CoA isomerase
LELEGDLQQEAAETEDFKEGVSAFLQKRKPNYKGK